MFHPSDNALVAVAICIAVVVVVGLLFRWLGHVRSRVNLDVKGLGVEFKMTKATAPADLEGAASERNRDEQDRTG